MLPCYLAYPLIYRPLAGAQAGARRSGIAALAACIASAQLGAAAVVVQTVASGISALPAGHFLALMLPIHPAICAIEGLATAALLFFLHRSRPELLAVQTHATTSASRRWPLLLGLGVAAAITGGVLSHFASSLPDGLEWSLAKVHMETEPHAAADLSARLTELQQRIALQPCYAMAAPATSQPTDTGALPAGNAGTALAGLVGGLLTLVLVLLIGLGLRRRRA